MLLIHSLHELKHLEGNSSSESSRINSAQGNVMAKNK